MKAVPSVSNSKLGQHSQDVRQPILSEIRAQTVRLAALDSLSGLLGRLLWAPSGVLIAYFLGPFQLGVLAVLRLIQQYVGYTHLGLLAVLPRNVPIAHGRGDREEVRSVVDVVFTGYTASLVVAIGVLWMLYAAGVTFKEALTLPRLVLLTLVLVFNGALTFLRNYAKAVGQLMATSRADLLLAVLLPALTIAGVALFALEGALLAASVTYVATLVYSLALLGWPRLQFRVDVRKTLDLLRTGLLVFVNKLGDSMFWGVDLIVIGILMTPIEVGLYSLALTGIATVHPFLSGFNNMVYRRMMEEAGKYGISDRSHFRKYAGSPLFVSYLMLNSVILGLAALGLSAVVRVALPEYAATPSIMVVLTLGYTVYGSMVFMRYYLDATGQLPRRLGMVFGAVLANVTLDYLAIKMGFGLQGVAWACTLSFFLNASTILTFCFRQIYADWWPGVRFVLQLSTISVLCVLFLIASANGVLFDQSVSQQMAERWLWAGADLVIKSTAFVAWCVGWYFVVFRRSHLERELSPVLRYLWTTMRAQINPGQAPT